VIPKNPDDQVTMQYENGVEVIDIRSPSGIGSASFELDSGAMPGEILLRLHLQGLEKFRLTSAEESLSASVSTADASIVDQKILSPEAESPLQPGHPLWMEIEIVSDQPAKAIPLEKGYFEIALPKEFLEKAGSTFEIEWIDFFR
jgi:hypothetical protein